jgi:hypothetical protein
MVALLIALNANADPCTDVNADVCIKVPTPVNETQPVVDFGELDLCAVESKLITVVNESSSALHSVTLTISGNAGEYCFNIVDYCFPTGVECETVKDIGTLAESGGTGDSRSENIYVNIKHPGNKKKKLTIDAVDANQNDISFSIPITGSSSKN